MDCLVFWTKNPAPLLPYLGELEERGYAYYFQVTLTPYGPDWEPGVPPPEERFSALRRLAAETGPAPGGVAVRSCAALPPVDGRSAPTRL